MCIRIYIYTIIYIYIYITIVTPQLPHHPSRRFLLALPVGDAGGIPEIVPEGSAGARDGLLRGAQGAERRIGVEGPAAPGFAGEAVLEEHALVKGGR